MPNGGTLPLAGAWMAATKERLVLEVKLAPLWQAGGDPPLPPEEPPEPPEPPTKRGGFSAVIVVLIIIVALLFLSGIGGELISAIAQMVVVVVSGMLMIASSVFIWYFDSAVIAVSTEVLPSWSVVSFLIATPIFVLIARSLKRADFPILQTYAVTKLAIRRRSLQSYVHGSLIIISCFHAAIFFQLFEGVLLIELSGAVVTVAQIVDQVRLAWFFPQTLRDVERALEEFGSAQ